MAELQPKTTQMEFSGVPGALGCTFGLPLLLYFMYFATTTTSSGESNQLLDLESLYAYLGWVGFLIILERVLPGKKYKGNLLRDGKTRLEYKLNGGSTTAVVVGLITSRITYSVLSKQHEPVYELIFVAEHYLQLLTASILASFVLATACYIASFRSKHVMLAQGGNTGNTIYDWFIGRELNPRIGGFDIKVFSELRPGLLLWLVLDVSFAYQQYLTYNGHLSDSMILILIFQLFYVIEGIHFEQKSLYMMDVIHDGFGYMLSFGDLTWVPFLYCVQARYLSRNPVNLGFKKSIGLLLLNFTGYYIFRASNLEKDSFRNNDPKMMQMKSIQTSKGTKLLCDGWWGKARHINYFGDWLMALSWTLTTGFNSFIPYIYLIYFAILLIHRERRDEEHCSKKYGKDWSKYEEIAKYRIIPYIY